jgi:serine protease Do
MSNCRAGPAALTVACSAITCSFARILAVSLAGLLTVASPAAARQAIDLSDLAAQVIDAVVNISTTRRANSGTESRQQGQRPEVPGGGEGPSGQPNSQRLLSSLGSGFVIDASGIIVTNEHVIRNAEEITVILNNGTRLRAELIGEDSYIDVAVLRVQPSTPLPVVKFADSDQIRVGEPVMAIGNPSGLGGTVTAGIVSAKNRDIRLGPFDNFIQTDAAINRGNSGGPLFNMAGDVIGINTLGLSRSGGSIGLNFAVPANTAQPIISQLREFGETKRGWLGVNVQEITNEIAEALRLDAPRGALISGVDPRGPAGPAGMRTGDVIVSFNGREVRSPQELPRIVAEAPVGSTVPVSVMRDGRSATLTVTLGRRETNIPTSRDRRTRRAPVVSTLGMQLSSITPELRDQLELRDDARGVVIIAVNRTSVAAGRGIRPGTVIAEVHNKAVESPSDFVRRVETLKAEGRRSAVFLVLNANGQRRLIALNLT